MDYSTTTSDYNTKHHAVAFSKTYPNFAFERVAEDINDPEDENSDYLLFGSFSSSTMVRVSELWSYDEIMERVNRMNDRTNNLSPLKQAPSTYSYQLWANKSVEYNKNKFKWDFHKGYGPDISFEVREKNGITTELGEVKMVIDYIDEKKHIHAGFGVQVVDPNINESGSFNSSLKNIMYVNNQKELFVDGIWLGGKLLRSDGNTLKWGDRKSVV